jgi:trehalose 6-phosphate phosphatase
MEEKVAEEKKVQVDSLLKAVAQAPRSLLMLDYDGTLAPFRTNPEKAFPYAGIAPTLQQIVRTGKTRIVIISGRDANDVLPLLDFEPRPEVWGLHGLQRVKPDGSEEVSPPDDRTVAALAAAGDWLLYQDLHDKAECKVGSVAVHWRGLSESEAEAIRGRVLLGWRPLAKRDRLDLLEFDGGIEIRANHADKGSAVRTILSEMNPGTPAAYLGDDVTDESAFQALNGRGMTVLVRPRWRRTAAQLWLKSPDEVLDLLKRWLQACQVRHPLGSRSAMAANK